METAVIDRDHFYIRILELPFRACRKILQSGPDRDHCIRLFCDLVRRQRPCDTDPAQTPRIAGLAGALAGLRLAKWDMEIFAKSLDGLSRF